MKTVLIFFLVFSVCSASDMVGAYTKQDAEDPKYMEIAWDAVKDVNQDHGNGEYALVPIKVLSAETQVVSGMNYKLNVEYGESSCPKTEVNLSCTPKDGGESYKYTVQKYEVPWEPENESISVQKTA